MTIKKECATAILEDLVKLGALELEAPQAEEGVSKGEEQVQAEMLRRIDYYQAHPDELLSWEDAKLTMRQKPASE